MLFAALLAVSIAFYGVGFATGRTTFGSHEYFASDLFHFHWPLRTIAARAYKAFELPQRTPLLGFGFPLLAEGQTAVLYPLNVLTLGLLPTALAINGSVLLHHALAGLGTFLLARHYRLRTGAAALGAVLFAFSGFFMVHARHLNMPAVAAWLPWLALAIELAWSRPSARTVTGLSVVTAMIVLAGHPQLAHAHAVFAFVWVLPRLRSSRRRGALAVACGALVGALLAAPQLLPMFELNALGPRSAGLGEREAAIADMQLRHLATFFDPYWFGDPARGTYPPNLPPPHWEIVASIGIPGLLLALSSLWPGRRRSRAPIARLWGVASVFLLLSLGANGPFGNLVQSMVPGSSYFRFSSRFLLQVAFALSLLAAAAADRWARVAPRLRLAWVLPVVALADLYRTFAHYNPQTEISAWTTPPETARAILKNSAGIVPPRLISIDREPMLFRALAQHRPWLADPRPLAQAREILLSNHQATFGLDAIQPYSPLTPLRASQVIDALAFLGHDGVGRLSKRGANLFGVEWLVSTVDLGPGYGPRVAGRRGAPVPKSDRLPSRVRGRRSPRRARRAARERGRAPRRSAIRRA